MNFLITYDIKCPKRWEKVFRLIKKNGLNIQLSCFEVEMSSYKLGKFLEELSKLIDTSQDVIYAYPIEPRLAIKLGKIKDLVQDLIL